MLKIPFPDHIFLKISKYRTENIHLPSTGKYCVPPCCVYNIISPQNITLQMPIFTRSSIVDVGRVSQTQLCFIYTLNGKVKQLSMKIRFVPNYKHNIRLTKHLKWYLILFKNLEIFLAIIVFRTQLSIYEGFFCENS